MAFWIVQKQGAPNFPKSRVPPRFITIFKVSFLRHLPIWVQPNNIGSFLAPQLNWDLDYPTLLETGD